jgi:hypothetical protein
MIGVGETVAVCGLPSYVTVYGVTTTVALALLTVSDALPVLVPKEPSPAKLAAAPVEYGDPLTLYELPQRLTVPLVATPLASVTPLPAELPFRVKVMVLPTTGVLSEVFLRVAVKAVDVPP